MNEIGKRALLPTGLRDLLPPDAAFEASVAERLLASFAAQGYERVKPPLVEFEEGLLNGAGAGLAEQTFRLMDPASHRMMAVRSDLTPQAYLDRGQFPNNTRIYADRSGKVLVDHILPYEALNEELGKVFASLGVPFEGELGIRAKAEYRTDRKQPDEVFTPEQIAWIRNRFSRESGITAQFGLGFKG